MSAATPITHQPIPDLAITVTPTVLTLFDGASLTISDDVPLNATGRRDAARSGLIYFYGGRIDRINGYLGGYLGQSSDLDGSRAATSLTRWAITQRRIIPAGSALLHRNAPYDDNYRRFVEARAIMAISAAGIWLLNTHTSAGLASARLTRAQVIEGQQLGTQIAEAILNGVFAGQTNPHPSPAANAREMAVRCVLHATRAVDTFEVMRALRASRLVISTGQSWDYTIRRDLRVREAETAGRPRVFNTWHRNRRLFWNPVTLTKRQALRGYDLAHP